VNKHLYLCHPLVLSSPTLMMHGHMNLKYTIFDFIYKRSNESWDSTFNNTDVNLMFNSFLNTYLRIFYSCFPLMKIKNNSNTISWITSGIKTSCKRKRELFLLNRNNNNPALKKYYKTYCRILAKVIKEAKRLFYNSRILKSDHLEYNK